MEKDKNYFVYKFFYLYVNKFKKLFLKIKVHDEDDFTVITNT